MKIPLQIAFLALLSVFCVSCASITPPEPDPAPKPVPEQKEGPWLVRELDQDGRKVHEWETQTYRHTLFPRTVSFVDSTGKTVNLTESFEIVKKP